MAKLIPPSIETLFACSNQQGTRLVFEWRVIHRKGRPFLLVPTSGASPKTSLELYSAQRWGARALRNVFPMIFRSPAARLCDVVTLEVNTASELIQFLARQSGVAPECLRAPAIKFGGLEIHKSRLVLLLVDGTGHPAKVVKVGLDAAGRADTDSEANFLEQLPPGSPGCIRMSGRLSTPRLKAFATDYFPGESPANDAGLEDLFNAWLHPGPPVPVESLASWRKLEPLAEHDQPLKEALAVLRAAMTGTKVRSTLQHGDFAPWNLRARPGETLQAYDWERGSLRGIPGWDWFHFIIQTAILVRRLPVERAAGEVEQLLASPRFQAFAARAGISDISRPLVLTYLLHQLWVVNPAEGWHLTGELYNLLSARWGLQPEVARLFPPQARATGAIGQLETAASRLINAFWEPRLNSKPSPPLRNQISGHWQVVLTSVLLLALVGGVQAEVARPVMFLPFYLGPCLLLTWFSNRRFGMFLATVATIMGPVIKFLRVPGYDHWEFVLWNSLMRFVMLQMGVLLVDKIRRGSLEILAPADNPRPARFQEGWAVLLACLLWLGGLVWLDSATPPQLGFLPLYLVPCMVLTLTFGLRWGILAGLAGAFCASTNEFKTDPQSSFALAYNWNFLVRFGTVILISLYLEKLRKGSILFYAGHHARAEEMAPVLAAKSLGVEVGPVLETRR